MTTKQAVVLTDKQPGKFIERLHLRTDKSIQEWGITREKYAPVMMSTSSLVMAACRPRLYFIWSEDIMSEAFLDALSIAFRLQEGEEIQRLSVIGHSNERTESSVRKHGLPLAQRKSH